MKKRLIAFVLALVLIFSVFTSVAEEYKRWIMCKPKTYVNLRMDPRKKGLRCGYLDSGDSFMTDGTRRNGFIAVLDAGDGSWVSEKYVVDEEPVEVNEYYVCVAVKQAACRKWVNGPRISGRRGWIKNGVRVMVYLIAGEWALTARGYIQSEWLEVDP